MRSEEAGTTIVPTPEMIAQGPIPRYRPIVPCNWNGTVMKLPFAMHKAHYTECAECGLFFTYSIPIVGKDGLPRHPYACTAELFRAKRSAGVEV